MHGWKWVRQTQELSGEQSVSVGSAKTRDKEASNSEAFQLEEMGSGALPICYKTSSEESILTV